MMHKQEQTDMHKKKQRALALLGWWPIGIVLLCVACICMSVIFILQNTDFLPIDRAEAEVHTGVFARYDIDYHGRSTRYMEIYFADGSRYNVHHTCVYAIEDAIGVLPAESGMTVLVNPRHGYVIEIVAEGRVLLPMEDAQPRLKNEATAFVYLGAGIICACIFLLAYTAHAVIKEKRKKAN